MKRKLMLLLATILSVSLLLTACGQKDIGEAKATQMGLAYLNRIFDADETEAQATRYMDEYFTYRDGKAVSAGDADSMRVTYQVRVAKSETQPLYEAWILGSTGELVSARQGEINIILTDEQKQKANDLFAQEHTWGEKHKAALAELKTACIQWVQDKMMEDYPVLFAAETGDYPHETMSITTTFFDSFHVVMLNGVVYRVTMQWPSMQVIGFGVESEN